MVFPPAQVNPGPTVPTACRTGFEINNYENSSFDFQATAAGGSQSLKLEVDAATYFAPDEMKIIAIGSFGQQLIFDTCRMRTSTYSDPTNGIIRPPEDSIRYFRPVLPQGTTTLRFDFTGARTPTYLKVLGLCDFTQTPANVQGGTPQTRPVGP